MLHARTGFACCVDSDRIYIAGGQIHKTASDLVEWYDVAKDSWFSLPNLSAPLYNAGLSVIDGNKLIVVGGFNQFH